MTDILQKKDKQETKMDGQYALFIKEIIAYEVEMKRFKSPKSRKELEHEKNKQNEKKQQINSYEQCQIRNEKEQRGASDSVSTRLSLVMDSLALLLAVTKLMLIVHALLVKLLAIEVVPLCDNLVDHCCGSVYSDESHHGLHGGWVIPIFGYGCGCGHY